ncbi:uncharacterized protein ColSpa_06954 [Colletotrichum spaethianum]|uniref:Uncharacterized protein n=1 Tax=Colletotrichum spaethianum TaxID=700344 RepID=A0AA37LHS7_9PEZI|nr:uncharacterized protein ColSpa_06954 [Colletotrichum spaethianum]GKT46773.1 hypothetical protein ColSpa_06954 [Colletotrichum spaethianum]
MAFTEIVFPILEADENARKAFYDNVPGLVKANFNVVGGPKASAVARILESTPINAEGHCGYLAIFSWESLDTIKDFMKSSGFANFKKSLMELVAGPPVLQFFQAPPDVAPEKTLEGSTHFFVIKAMGTEAQIGWAKGRWDELTAMFSTIAGDKVKYHTGHGKEVCDGHFAGFSGWKTIAVGSSFEDMPPINLAMTATDFPPQALNKTLEQAEVQKQLHSLAEAGGSISSFILELNHVL